MIKEELHEAITPIKRNLILQKVNSKVLLGAVVLIIAGAPGTYFFLQYNKTQQLLNNPTAASKEEIKGLLEKISKLMVLPSDENPTVATVSDKSKLSGQAFFAKAENGDKVIIYTSMSRAILYRPSVDRIIDVTSVNVNGPDVAGASIQPNESTQASEAASTSSQSPLSVAILNGTKISGLAAKAQASLQSKVAGFTVTTKGNAKNEYEQTLVVDVAGKNQAKALEMAKHLGGSVVALPSGEDKPQADILILLGPQASSL